MKLSLRLFLLSHFLKIIAGFKLIAFIFLLTGQSVFASDKSHTNTQYIDTQYADGYFSIVKEEKAAIIYVDENDHKGVIRAVNNLKTDIYKVTNQSSVIVNTLSSFVEQKTTVDNETSHESLIIIGTLGQSQLIDQLVAHGKINVDNLKGQWEAFRVQLIDNPFEGVEQALVILGSDKRGTTFGVYDLSEKMGVSPWYWWADVPAKKHQQLFVKQNTNYQDQPKVKYRGIFLNDEAPALTNWVKEKFGDFNHQFYEHIFELLLRSKANFLWPAMWNNAFSDDDPMNMVLADEYGIVMSNSHHEPMLCADKEWDRRGEGQWDYSVNKKNLYEFWQACAQRNKPYESIYTLGMRGQQDTPMSEGHNIQLLEEIVADQRKILKHVFNDRELSDVPQVWTLYKEVQGYYERGMRVPDDVTLLWSDDNWGNIRHLPTAEERQRSGGAGVYYHFDYVGGPRSYRWINTTPIAKIWEQMNLAYQFEANQIWLTNVGDLKPMEYPTDFFLTMAWDPTKLPKEKLPDFGVEWATQQFGEQYAEQIANILNGYTRHNGRRKPELVDETTYSQLNYNEAEYISNELTELLKQAETIYAKIAEVKQDAFFQLVLHPIKASSTIFELYNNVAKNHLYALQGRASTNHYADKARQLFTADGILKDHYHQLGNGRWNHFMDQTHIGYTHWNNPPIDVIPRLSVNSPAHVSDMGVAVEGSTEAWPKTGNLMLDEFSPYGKQQRYIEIFNKGTKIFKFTAESSEKWLQLSKTSGVIDVDTKIWASIDWKKAPRGKSTANVMIKGTGWGGARVQISIFNPGRSSKVKGFVEADGYISIEAASGKAKTSISKNKANKKKIKNASTHTVKSKQASWQEIPLHGRTLSSMSAFAGSSQGDIDKSFTNYENAPYLEYDIYTFSQGEFEIQTIVAPTLNIVPDRGLRFAIGIDNEKPQIVDILNNTDQNTWQESVKNGVRYAVSLHNINKPGAHKLKIYMVDVGVAIQKIIINTGGLKESYLGPQQSTFK